MATLFTKLDSFSLQLQSDQKKRHVFFVICALLITTLYGYYFGTFDQASHIPFLKKTLDPSLFPNDRFFELRNTHYSFFWLLLAPFLHLNLLEIVMFFVHIVSIYATIWGVWSLSKLLFNDSLVALGSVVALIFPHIGFSGFPLFEFSMLNRTVVLPLELFALTLYLRKYKLTPFILLGALYNFHALSVHFFAGMLFFDILVRIKKVGIGLFLRSLFVFVLFASPVLFWKFGHSGISLLPQYEWFDILNRAVFSHLFNVYSQHNRVVAFLTLSGMSSIVLFFIVAKKYVSERHVTVRNWFVAGIIACVVQYVATYIYPVPILIQMQILRIGVIMVVFLYLYLVAHIVKSVRENHIPPGHFIFLFISIILSFSPLVFLFTWGLYTLRPTLIQLSTMIAIVLYSIVLLSMTHYKLWMPGFYIFPQKTPFVEVQLWAKKNTSKDAIFITPPEIWWMYETEWRVLSERSSVVTWSELLEAAFDPSYITYWKPRFEDVAPGALARFRGNFFENRQIIRNAYYAHSADQFETLGKKYKATYLVSETQYIFPFAQVFSNGVFTVYKLP